MEDLSYENQQINVYEKHSEGNVFKSKDELLNWASFEKIHSLLELQHTDIKASFEKSLTVVQHQFKPSQFMELLGNVSISAVEYLLVESKRANSIGIDVEACGCVLRHTHGLPCVHEIADYIGQDRPIPLATIHSQWRQLHISICKKRGNGASTLETNKKRPVKGKEKVNVKGKVYITRAVKPGAYVDAFPSGLKPYIKFVKDVAAYGNCGFRAITASIGHSENDWAQVRHDLLGELHAHKEEYITLYGSYERFEELTSILSYFEDSPGYSHWMTMLDMGHLVASCYNLVLYHLSLQQCLTFLPLRTVPVPQLDRREIAIGFVNGNHFVQVLLQPGHLVPSIATNWRKYHHPCAVDWDDTYMRRIQHFKDIIHDTVAA
ncbi:uncharacterized protein LOC114306953 [Camellia sinensis]|uniref:uncharacterized protein LOC114306953 n=1 Tax=Camellia sinensis TaxID=4442 RepID=UPI001036A271|nr:uncharacterized protein LOC114306953 [Camellia sinensis]